ncbi:hypothetical protein SVIOM74S_07875 [Streptomyces violarus]
MPVPPLGLPAEGPDQDERTPAGEEEYKAGQAYYWAPGHVPVALEDSEFVEFSPTEDFKQVIEHVVAQSG